MEFAGEDKTLVFWRSNVLPDTVAAKVEPYTKKTDLYQVGLLIQDATALRQYPHPQLISFADELCKGSISSAEEALHNPVLLTID